MQRFARASVVDVEREFGPRAEWHEDRSNLADDDVVMFYVTGEQYEGGTWACLGDCKGQLCVYGKPSDVPRDWLEPEAIRFYFDLSVEAFLERYAT